MSVPYEFPLVQSEIGPRLKIVGDEQATRENSFKAVNDACVTARQKDTHWGLLLKTGGVNAFGYAADVWLYDFGNGTCQVVDVVGNSEGAPPPEGGPRSAPVPSWGEKDIRQISEWSAPMPVFEPGSGGGSTPPPSDELAAKVAALEDVVTQQGTELDDLTVRVAALESLLAGGLHCHGPVNLPIVLESLTSLRAKGDIDVQVKPGQAPAAPVPASGKKADQPVTLTVSGKNVTLQITK